ncbi:hypothetical protein BH20GEM2_BH20GEM2_00460 [soil metagenome]
MASVATCLGPSWRSCGSELVRRFRGGLAHAQTLRIPILRVPGVIGMMRMTVVHRFLRE